MIVTATFAGKTKVQYGVTEMLLEAGGNIDVPDFVAKAFVAAGAVCGADLSASVETMLGADEDWECSYMVRALSTDLHGDRAQALALYAAKGAPSVVVI